MQSFLKSSLYSAVFVCFCISPQPLELRPMATQSLSSLLRLHLHSFSITCSYSFAAVSSAIVYVSADFDGPIVAESVSYVLLDDVTTGYHKQAASLIQVRCPLEELLPGPQDRSSIFHFSFSKSKSDIFKFWDHCEILINLVQQDLRELHLLLLVYVCLMSIMVVIFLFSWIMCKKIFIFHLLPNITCVFTSQ